MLTKKVSDYGAIPMYQFPAGMYMVEVTLENGKRGIYKVLNASIR